MRSGGRNVTASRERYTIRRFLVVMQVALSLVLLVGALLFVRSLNGFVRAGYELCTFVIVWVLAYEAMVLKRTLMIRYEAATTGSSIAQVIDRHNASGGMWAFAEGMEVMYLVVLLYLLRPVVFNIVDRVAATAASPKARAE